MSEKLLEKSLRENIKIMGGLALKFTSPGFTGVPDRLVLMPDGKHYFVELKSSGQKLRSRQEYVKRQLESLGHPVFIIDSRRSLDSFLKGVQNC